MALRGACVAPVAAGRAVAHVHLLAAMTASEQPSEKEFAAPCRSARDGAALSGRVVGNHALIPLEFLPCDVAFVLILDQYIPFRRRTPNSASHELSPVVYEDLALRAPEGIRPGVNRIGQNVAYGVVDRQLPYEAACFLGTCLDRQLDAFFSEPHIHLTYAL